MWFREVAEVLKEKYPEYKVKTKELPRCPVVMASMFDKGVKKILPLWNKVAYIDNTKSREILGIEYHTAEEAVAEMGRSLIETKMIADKRKQK